MASPMMEVASLGRPFTLGMLYDAQKDKLLPGITLWDETTLKEKMIQNPQHSSQFQIAASDSFKEKSSLLDVDASLKASFMSGLIEVNGSAKYLNDAKKSHRQSRVTCHYKSTTVFKQLTALDSKNIQQIDDSVKTLATHVVTGILYGANAFFVFDSEKLDSSNVQKIEGSMQAVINKIPSFNVEGKVDIKLSDEEKDTANKFTCKFYGDFILESNPANFEDAVKTYIELPKLLGDDRENGVPMKVWMMPLNHFDSSAAEVTPEISPGLTGRAQDLLGGFQDLKMRCNDCLEENNYFPLIHERLSHFQNLCDKYIAGVKEKMAKTLQSLKAGGKDETGFKAAFDGEETSPFSLEKLKKWLEDKEREVSVITSCVEMTEGAKIVRNQAELDRELLDPEVEDVLCFVFTSVETTDPYLQEMSDYLDPLPSTAARDGSPSTKWFFSADVINKMREKAKEFGELHRALKNNSRYRFLIAVISNDKYEGASIYHYRNIVLLTDDFSKPDVTNVENITNKRDLMWYATDLSLDPDTAHPRILLSEGDKKATQGEEQSYPDLPQRYDHYVQVLGRQELTGRHYWEVEWSVTCEGGVDVGVTYGGAPCKGDHYKCSVGRNDMSWSFGHRFERGSFTYYVLHSSYADYVDNDPKTSIGQLGVYLDWSAGTLSFYKVIGDKLIHFHTYKTTFSEPLYLILQLKGEKTLIHLCL
ncbi:neoverrucotoxin subunit alpha-like [Cololabis saira]|uniref:neoverrucotoxin subunit alpha-like n=1 Tax=Cololabis saira TaxID=129043 RepID=UPI002AD3E0CC|nr:neoverrucotoxin subunit alpha-like [Cololabis saira]